MISISKKRVRSITKIVASAFLVYTLLFIAYKVFDFYKNSFEKERLEKELILKKQETHSLKNRINILKQRMKKVEASYIKKDELETRVKDIFSRMSVLDYNLNYLDSKKMCVDRHIIIAQILAPTPKSLSAAQGVLSYLGNIKQSDENETIYFIDYIAKPKESKDK